MLRSRKLLFLALAAVVVAAPVRAAEIDKLTPSDAQIIMTFNIRQALDSPLAKKKGIVDIVKNGIEKNAEAKQALTALGLDVTKDIESVSMSIGGSLLELQNLGGKAPEKMLVTIRGKFDSAKLEAAAKAADTIKITKEGAVTVYEIKEKGGDTGYATLSGTDTIAVSPSKDYLLKSVKNAGNANKDLAKAAGKIPAKDCVWMAFAIGADLRGMIAQASPQGKAVAEKLESLTFGVAVDDAINVDMNFNTTDEATPKALKAQVDMVLPILGGLIPGDNPAGPVAQDVLKTLKVTANKDALNISVKVTEDTLEKIIKLAMMGAGK